MAITPRSAAGFTLLELSIVLAILGVATAMTFPTISRMTTHARVNQAAMVVAQDLSLASSAAARERKPIRIARGADRASITIAERAGGKVLSTRWLGKSDAYALDSITFNKPPLPYTRKITVDSLSPKLRRVTIIVTPLNTVFKPDTLVLQRTKPGNNPFNKKP